MTFGDIISVQGTRADRGMQHPVPILVCHSEHHYIDLFGLTLLGFVQATCEVPLLCQWQA